MINYDEIYKIIKEQYSGKVFYVDSFQKMEDIEKNVSTLLNDVFYPFNINTNIIVESREFDGEVELEELMILYDILHNELTNDNIDKILYKLSFVKQHDYRYMVIGSSFSQEQYDKVRNNNMKITMLSHNHLIKLHKTFRFYNFESDEHKKYTKKTVVYKLTSRDKIINDEEINAIFKEHQKTFDDIYKILEENALDYRYSHQIGNIFNPIIEQYREENNPYYEKIAHNERETFFFRIDNAELLPMATFSDADGNPINYPDITKFDEDSLNYIEKRLESTNNIYLKGRYSIVLWASSKKHVKYADSAIDSFTELVDVYIQLDTEQPEKNYGLEVVDMLKNAYLLGKIIRSNKCVALSEKIIKTIKEYNWESNNSFAVRLYLMQFMLDNKFDDKYFDSMLNICEKLISYVDGNQKIMVMEVAQKIALKTSNEERIWIRKIAEENEKMMENALEHNPLVADHYWEKAYESYQQIGDKTKLEDLLNKRDEIKSKAQVQEIKIEINVEDIDRITTKISDNIIKYKEVDVIKTLIMDEGLIPNINTVKNLSKDILNEHPLLGILPIIIYDEQGNISEKFAEKNEIEQYRFLNQYRLSMEIMNNILLDRIMYKLIQSDALTANGLIDFLSENSWYGETLYKKTSKEKPIPYTWLDMIKPIIRCYFQEVKKYVDGDSEVSFILPIDSFALKIEGIIRDMHQLVNIPTSYAKRIGRDQVIREKDLNILFSENKIPYFTENEITYFKFVLTEQMGYNLRNRVAHSLLLPQAYTFSIANMCILIILKISKFQLNRPKEP